MCTTLRINMTQTGKNISRLRKENGITVKQTQDVRGFNTPQAVYKWQRGETMPSLDNILVLSKLFNKSVEEIVAIEK